ncbi:succinate--CoA ligase subunit alpha [Candidatus Carsonella ruddii]|uniref:succinate--CoA ligase subunit alpha n=1 Tax=Carsonella ruddii TaxID=114186 RepID=UPI003D817FA0
MFNFKILSCGLTGNFGIFHTKISLKYGTKISCGLNYKKRGSTFLNLPIFSSSLKSLKITNCRISIIFIPSVFCKNIILENIFSGFKIIICITENIPIFDILEIKKFIIKYNILFVGPNTPGLILPSYKIRLGIFPTKYLKSGKLGIISRSGTLMYEAIKISFQIKIGQSFCLGIGGDYIPCFNIKNFLHYFTIIKNTKKILVIGEIGGILENFLIKLKNKKLYFYIVGIFSPIEIKMGHAGAINNKANDILKKIKKIKKKHLIINDLKDINLIK